MRVYAKTKADIGEKDIVKNSMIVEHTRRRTTFVDFKVGSEYYGLNLNDTIILRHPLLCAFKEIENGVTIATTKRYFKIKSLKYNFDETCIEVGGYIDENPVLWTIEDRENGGLNQ